MQHRHPESRRDNILGAAFYQEVIEADLTELIDDDGRVAEVRMDEETAQQGRLAAAEITRNDGHASVWLCSAIHSLPALRDATRCPRVRPVAQPDDARSRSAPKHTSVVITSAYFSLMSKRLTAWAVGPRSYTHSWGIATLKL